MIVKELIAVLQTLDQDATVQIGYEITESNDETCWSYENYDDAYCVHSGSAVTIASTYCLPEKDVGKRVFPNW